MTSRSDAQPSSNELVESLRTSAEACRKFGAQQEHAEWQKIFRDLATIINLSANEIEQLQRAAVEPSALQQELAVTNKLLDERNRILDAIPECPVHGRQCVPHAIEWVKERESIPPKLARWRCVSYCLCDPSTTKGHFVRDDVSGTWVKYDDIGSGSTHPPAVKPECTCWETIDALIRPGELPGRGIDETAQRNGLILAANALMKKRRDAERASAAVFFDRTEEFKEDPEA